MAGLLDDIWIFSDERDLLDYVDDALRDFPQSPTGPLALANAIRGRASIPPYIPEQFNELLLLVQNVAAKNCRLVSHIQIPLLNTLISEDCDAEVLSRLLEMITANDPWNIGNVRYLARSWHLTRYAFDELEHVARRLEKICAGIPEPDVEEYHEEFEFDLYDASQRLLETVHRAIKLPCGTYILTHFYV